MTRDDHKVPEADVCLVLEGGFPNVVGGVSAWVDELTRNLPDVRFTVASLRDEGVPVPGTPRYAPSSNVVSLVDLPVSPDRNDGSEAADRLPAASVYHSCITGRASAAAAIAAHERGRPLLITEHGLAWRESHWITGWCWPWHSTRPQETPMMRTQRLRRQAHEAYAQATAVTSVCAANVVDQRRLGAPAERSMLIPNCAPGGSVRPAAETEVEPSGKPFTVGFVGRVVPIKDLFTFLHAAALVRRELAAAFVIVGPLDHDPDYAQRCQELARRLGIADAVRFVGEADPSAWYSRFDAVALTSVSEAQPLALLEAMAAGVPAVSTRVGGCAELLVGPVRGRRTGLAGLLVPPRDPRAAAHALLTLAHNPELRRRLGAAGRERARHHHHPVRVWGTYRSLYERAAA